MCHYIQLKGGVGSSKFNYHLNHWLKHSKVSGKLNHEYGEKLFVDYTGKNFCADNDNCNLIQQEVLLKKGLEFDIVNIFDKVIGGKNVKIIELNEK